MEMEIQNFTKIWMTAILSLIVCHQIICRIPSGAARLFSLLPIIYLFTTFPLHLSSFHLQFLTFFYFVWIGNFKLLLFAFNQGPLCTTPPLSLLHFISIGILPIETKQTPSPISLSNKMIFLKNLLKCCSLALIIHLYKYKEFIHPWLIIVLYGGYMYLGLQLMLAIPAMLVRAFLGLELKPQFNKPYLATSLQDFWSHRWNLIVPSILRPTVYYPMRRISTPIIGIRWARSLSILVTFLVSGLMHEVGYYYLSYASPTWEMTWLFILHGLLVAVEVELKKAGWVLPPTVSRPLTLGITGATIILLIRDDIKLKAIKEYSFMIRFVGDMISYMVDRFGLSPNNYLT